MNTIQIKNMEDILQIANDVETVVINKKNMLYYLYKNNVITQNKEPLLNVAEVRKKYADTLKEMYKNPSDQEKEEIKLNKEDILKMTGMIKKRSPKGVVENASR